MGLNKYMRTLRRMDLAANPRGSVDLIEGQYTSALHLYLQGEVTVAGGTTSGTLVAEGVERLLDNIRLVYDGFHLVNPVEGRELRAISRRMVANIVAADRLADANAQVSTPISLYLMIPFARRYLADPFETVLPPLRVNNEFTLYVDLASTASGGAGSDPGTGALIRGGDRVVTFDSLTLDVVQEYSRNGKSPLYLPVISVQQTAQFDAANAALPLELRSANRFDGLLLHTVEGPNRDNADLINEISFMSGSTRFLDRVPIEILNADEQSSFPSVGGRAAGESDETGYDFLLMADNGKLGNVVDPRVISQPVIEFNVDTPGTTPGLIRAVFMDLITQPGVTAAQ